MSAAKAKFAIVVFPGSNCDQDCHHVATELLDCDAEYVWHRDTDLKGADVVILPGGFAHGDYLRTGAMARFSPIMGAVRAFADRGGPVLGICNGFQILLEAGLLPGAMLRNKGLIRIGLKVPQSPEFTISVVSDPYGCNTSPPTDRKSTRLNSSH